MTSATVFAIRISCAGWVVEKIVFGPAECTFCAKADGCSVFPQTLDCAVICGTLQGFAHVKVKKSAIGMHHKGEK
jgi:hypothetical protein